jgi:hypothetical protein
MHSGGYVQPRTSDVRLPRTQETAAESSRCRDRSANYGERKTVSSSGRARIVMCNGRQHTRSQCAGINPTERTSVAKRDSAARSSQLGRLRKWGISCETFWDRACCAGKSRAAWNIVVLQQQAISNSVSPCHAGSTAGSTASELFAVLLWTSGSRRSKCPVRASPLAGTRPDMGHLPVSAIDCLCPCPAFPGYWRIRGFGDNLQELRVQENGNKVVLGKQSWPWARCGNDSRPSAPCSQGCSPTIITQRINVQPVKALVPHSILTSSRNRQLAMVLHTRITWMFFFLLLP